MYSMPSERITSTMKSEPGRPGDAGSAAGTSVSAAWAAAEGNFTAGAAAALCGTATVEAAPAPATPTRNLRRSTFIVSMRAFLRRAQGRDLFANGQDAGFYGGLGWWGSRPGV